MTNDDLMPIVAANRRAFGDVLEGLSDPDWETPSLCVGWRVREVVAHMTMPFRYPAPRFLGELVRSRGNFARMADRVARRDAQAPIGTLLDGWRTNENHPWKPPGGGLKGALTHDVVHGLDITIPLGVDHPVSDHALRVVLDNATSSQSLKHFGVDVSAIRFEADDLDWAFGDGEPLRGRARYLLMVLMDRRLPADLLSGPATARFTAGA
ncbi:MAG: maleylpyruvate isomerase family mycothiol-dependent enzyme [Blastococcus sp.]